MLKIKSDNKDDNLVMGEINPFGSGIKGTARTKVYQGYALKMEWQCRSLEGKGSRK